MVLGPGTVTDAHAVAESVDLAEVEPAARAVVETAAATGPGRADAVDLYHYGLLPYPVLDRVPRALGARG
ncbi:hypothetical protein GCM10009540_28690 [Streptomyces turgidiscabies]